VGSLEGCLPPWPSRIVMVREEYGAKGQSNKLWKTTCGDWFVPIVTTPLGQKDSLVSGASLDQERCVDSGCVLRYLFIHCRVGDGSYVQWEGILHHVDHRVSSRKIATFCRCRPRNIAWMPPWCQLRFLQDSIHLAVDIGRAELYVF
jgi:hypothetical protein